MPLAKQLNLHALFEERERLREIANAELVSGQFLGILHAKVKPLLMALRICVNLAKHIVLLNDDLFSGPRHLHDLVIERERFNPLQVSRLYR